jgi:hypothetical protein
MPMSKMKQAWEQTREILDRLDKNINDQINNGKGEQYADWLASLCRARLDYVRSVREEMCLDVCCGYDEENEHDEGLN